MSVSVSRLADERDTGTVDHTDPKSILHRYLRTARAALLWKLDGTSDYDARRPLTTTGTNLLGLVKHLSMVEVGYLCDTFGRPHDVSFAWDGREPDVNEDMFATADESRDHVIERYRRAAELSDQTIDELELDSTGAVPWWPDDVNPVSLEWIIVHVIAETNRHLGHADVLREQVDGHIGFRHDTSNLPDGDVTWWAAYVDRVDAAARAASGES